LPESDDFWAAKVHRAKNLSPFSNTYADSADSGQAFRLKADSESGRSRTAFR
jgi:hypothetical protein